MRPSAYYTVENKRTGEQRAGFAQFDDNPNYTVLSFETPLKLDPPHNYPAESKLETFDNKSRSRHWWGQGDGGDCGDWFIDLGSKRDSA